MAVLQSRATGGFYAEVLAYAEAHGVTVGKLIRDALVYYMARTAVVQPVVHAPAAKLAKARAVMEAATVRNILSEATEISSSSVECGAGWTD